MSDEEQEEITFEEVREFSHKRIRELKKTITELTEEVHRLRASKLNQHKRRRDLIDEEIASIRATIKHYKSTRTRLMYIARCFKPVAIYARVDDSGWTQFTPASQNTATELATKYREEKNNGKKT